VVPREVQQAGIPCRQAPSRPPLPIRMPETGATARPVSQGPVRTILFNCGRVPRETEGPTLDRTIGVSFGRVASSPPASDPYATGGGAIGSGAQADGAGAYGRSSCTTGRRPKPARYEYRPARLVSRSDSRYSNRPISGLAARVFLFTAHSGDRAAAATGPAAGTGKPTIKSPPRGPRQAPNPSSVPALSRDSS